MEAPPPPSCDFFEPPPPPPPHQKTMFPHHGASSPRKNEAPLTEKQTPPLKSEAPFQEMISRKNSKKSETVINICVSLIKQRWKNILEIRNFRISHLEHSKFRKKSETVC